MASGRRPKSAQPSRTEPARLEQPIAPCGLTTWGDMCPGELAVIEAQWEVRAGPVICLPSASTGIGAEHGGILDRTEAGGANPS
jgi:hypothetical protein